MQNNKLYSNQLNELDSDDSDNDPQKDEHATIDEDFQDYCTTRTKNSKKKSVRKRDKSPKQESQRRSTGGAFISQNTENTEMTNLSSSCSELPQVKKYKKLKADVVFEVNRFSEMMNSQRTTSDFSNPFPPEAGNFDSLQAPR